MMTQVFGGVGLSAGATVGSPARREDQRPNGSRRARGTFQTFGAALLALPIAAVAHRAGRRPSLTLAYALAVAGAALVVVAAASNCFSVFLLGSALSDRRRRPAALRGMPPPTSRCRSHRGRDLSLVVW